MKAKKLVAGVLSLAMAATLFAACGSKAPADSNKSAGSKDGSAKTSGEPAKSIAKDKLDPLPWKDYDQLIADIKKETDTKKRVAMMHKAEDMLMDTGAILPLYYYNDVYMMKQGLTGFYANPYGFKFFQYVEKPGADSITVNLASEPAHLDPALNSTVDGACLAVASFAGLYTYDKDGKRVPDCAEKAEASKDGLTWTFTMKDGLKWSNGEPLTAKDFEYSWKRAASTETAADYNYMFNGIKGFPDNLDVKASEDGKTLTVVLVAPCPYFLDLAAFPAFFPVYEKGVEAAPSYKATVKDKEGKEVEKEIKTDAWAREAGFVSNGPFMLTEWTHKKSMTYTKNPYYLNADKVKLQKLNFMLQSDQSIAYQAYKKGELDFIDAIPPDEMDNAKKSPEFYKIDQLGTYYVSFNVKSKLFNGMTHEQASNLRKGLSYLIDRQYIIDTVGKSEQKPANSFIPPTMANGSGGEFKANSADYKYPDEKDAGYFDPTKVDVAKAKELLEKAGFKFDGDKLSAETPLSLDYITNDGAGHVAIAQSIQNDFKQIGITMNIKQNDWATFLDLRKQGKFDVARNGWLADFNDPINMLEMWTKDSGNNDCQFGR